MLIIPAIDFKDGKVVNLVQGQLDKSTIYSDDPVAMADRWQRTPVEFARRVQL